MNLLVRINFCSRCGLSLIFVHFKVSQIESITDRPTKSGLCLRSPVGSQQCSGIAQFIGLDTVPISTSFAVCSVVKFYVIIKN